MKKANYPLLFILFWVGIVSTANAQVKVRYHKEEPKYLFELNQKARSYGDTGPDSALIIVQQILSDPNISSFPLNAAEAYLSEGLAKNAKGNWGEAEISFRKALSRFRLSDDSLVVAYNLDYLGYAMLGQGYLDKHFELQLQALDYRQRFGGHEVSIARSYSIIGSIYFKQGKYDKALELYLKTLEIRKTIKSMSPTSFGFTLRNIGKVEMKKKNYDKAIKYYREAIDSFQVRENNVWIRQVYNLLGKLYQEKGDYIQAEENFDQALEMSIQLKSISQRGDIYYDLAKLADIQNDPTKTITLLDSAIVYFQKANSKADLRNSYHFKAQTLENLNQAKQALFYFNKYDRLKDTLISSESAQKIAELNAQYQISQREQRIKLLEREQEQEKTIRLLLFLSLALALATVFSVLRLNAKRKKAYAALQVEKEKADKLNEDLQTTQKQLIQSEKMASLGQLTSGIAHEINNPLNFISSNLEALQLDINDILNLFEKIKQLEVGDPHTSAVNQLIQLAQSEDLDYAVKEAKQMIKDIDYGSERISEIVKGLQIFSYRSDDFSTVENLNQTVKSALVILNNKIKNKKINIKLELGDLPQINCQPNKLSQVFVNIIDNAIQAMPDNGILSIESFQKDDQVFIRFKDNGQGMDEATLKQVFDPFFTTKDVGEGTGLGMAISYGIIHEHRGEIEIQSKIKQGAEVSISLPIHRSPSSSQTK